MSTQTGEGPDRDDEDPPIYVYVESPADEPARFRSFAPPSMWRVGATEGEERDLDLTGQQVQDYPASRREPIGHRDVARYLALGGFSLFWVVAVTAQVWLAAALSTETWNRVGPVLAAAATTLAGLIGVAVGYLFGKDKG